MLVSRFFSCNISLTCQVIAIPDDYESRLSEQEIKKNGKDPMEAEEASNGDLTESFKENEVDDEKKIPEEVEKTKMKSPEEGRNGSCLIHTN